MRNIREWRQELERLEEALNRLGPDEVCCDGLSARQCVILRILTSREGTRLSDLATMVGITPSAMTRAVEKLERLGFINRLHGQFSDARAITVAITESGQEARAYLETLALNRTKEIIAGIPVQERQHSLHYLRVLNRAIERPECCAITSHARGSTHAA